MNDVMPLQGAGPLFSFWHELPGETSARSTASDVYRDGKSLSGTVICFYRVSEITGADKPSKSTPSAVRAMAGEYRHPLDDMLSGMHGQGKTIDRAVFDAVTGR